MKLIYKFTKKKARFLLHEQLYDDGYAKVMEEQEKKW